MTMIATTLERGGYCLFCCVYVAPAAGQSIWCEDGSPVHCDQHFDAGGYHIICSDGDACSARRKTAIKEQHAAKAARAQAAQDEKDTARAESARLSAQVAVLLSGLTDHTEHSPYYTTASLAGLELIFDAPAGVEAGTPGGLGVHKLYRVPEGVVVVFLGRDLTGLSVSLHSTPEQADACRLAAAREQGISVEKAREAVAREYIGDDQRRMYQLVLDAEAV